MPTTAVPSHRRLAAAGLAAALAATLAACGDDGDASSADAPASELAVTDVWARASAAGQANGAAYMVMTGGDEDDRLLAASVDAGVACTTEIHETVPVGEAGDGPATTGPAGGVGAMGGDDCPDGAPDGGGTATTAASLPMGAEDTGGAAGTTTTDGAGDHGGEMGAMTMREVSFVEVPAGGEVVLEPGGYHLMLIGLAAPLVAGDTFDIALELEVAGTRTVTAEVRDR